MSIEIAGMVISGITALTNLLEIWKVARMRKEGISVTQVEFYREIKSLPSIESSEAAITLSKMIPDDILNAILKNIKEAIKRFSDAIMDPACNKQCEDREHEIAASTICSELERIKRLNNQQLPRELEKLWISFQCGSSN